MADMPNEDQDILKEYMVEIPSDVSYESLKEKLIYFLENEQERKVLTDRGYEISRTRFSQKNYAERFIAITKDYLKEHGPKKIWT